MELIIHIAISIVSNKQVDWWTFIEYEFNIHFTNVTGYIKYSLYYNKSIKQKFELLDRTTVHFDSENVIFHNFCDSLFSRLMYSVRRMDGWTIGCLVEYC